MGWRSVIITQHAKLTYSMNMMIVQTRDGVNQIPIDDINLVLISTSQAVITSALISKLAEKQSKVIFVDDKYQPISETVDYYPGSRNLAKLENQFRWNEKRKELLWTKIVTRKIQNQIAVLQNYKLDGEDIQEELDRIEINDSTNREALAARKYFMKMFGKDFIRRNSDVINAALDYGYAILLSAFDREIAVNGYLSYLERFTFSKEIKIVDEFNINGESHLYSNGELLIGSLLSNDEQIEKINKDIEFERNEISRGERMLNNPGFVSKAPKEKIELERNKLNSHKEKLNLLLEKLKNL